MFYDIHAIIIIFGGSIRRDADPVSARRDAARPAARHQVRVLAAQHRAARPGRRARQHCRDRAQIGPASGWRKSRRKIRSSPRASASSPTATTPISSATTSSATATTSSPISTKGRRSIAPSATARPAFGMIGTLIGMVQMFANMTDPSKLGPFMAVALLATLYGALVANLFCLPIADKLHVKLVEEEVNRTLIIDGILMIREFEEPDARARNAARLSPRKAPPRRSRTGAGLTRLKAQSHGEETRRPRGRSRLVRDLRRPHGAADELLRHARRVLHAGQGRSCRSSRARCATPSACSRCAINGIVETDGAADRARR